ncbi:MAG: L-threonylcarbamoyladenylate synthase [Planctomycetota bacterium]
MVAKRSKTGLPPAADDMQGTRPTPAVFLDRDGTLIEDRGYLSEPRQVVFYPETIHALRKLQAHFLLFIVTNQSGISQGVLRPEDVARVHACLVQYLKDEGVTIRQVYSCPHAREDGCACRKPNPFFLLQAACDHGVDLSRSFVIGDHPADIACAANAGARGIYVLSGHGAKHRNELAVPCEVTEGISDAADAVLCARAAEVLRHGGIVAFPTETVYGLGADALDRIAVRRIFDVKGRPRTHPLIVHLESSAMLGEWAVEVPDIAVRLAEHFWPGPLTIILKRSTKVPDEVTGSQETIGIRVPSHSLAQRLLKEFGGGLAAPSANRFGRVSPTTAEHVLNDLGSDVDFILDGGPCKIGIESTIVDLSAGSPVILRPGGVPQEDLEDFLGQTVPIGQTGMRAPGAHASHYAPHAEVRIVSPGQVEQLAARLSAHGVRTEILQPEAQTLYSALREADRRNVEVIIVPCPSETGLGLAVADRLRKASEPRLALQR